MEYLVRQARITDVDRLYALCAERGMTPPPDSPLDAIGLLRQLVYMASASVAVAETGRQLAGGAILGLRPSVRAGGFIGTVDLLVVADGSDAPRVADLLIEDLLNSARRKGCAGVEVTLQAEGEFNSSWQDHGFTRAAGNLYRAAVSARTPTSR